MRDNYKLNKKQSCFYITWQIFLMLNLIFAKITKGNLKLIIIVIILSLLYVLIYNHTKYKH